VTDPSTSLAAEYSDKADAYQQHWSPVIGPMAMPLLDELPLAGATWIVDVGAGTGAHLQPLAARAPKARIVGIDRATGMLRLARGGSRRFLAAMDAQTLALRSGTFDVATLIFMLFHVPDPIGALVEVRRVLRAGGTAGIVTWSRDDAMPGLDIWKEALDHMGAAPDPRDPIVMQRERMDTPGKLSGLLRRTGFAVERTWTQVFEYHWTIDRIVDAQLGCGLTARRIGSLSARDAAQCEARVRRRLAEFGPDALVYRPEILFATANS
jgi:ubiquinone/menaquinone biosynthesis C-methylase UbiE